MEVVSIKDFGHIDSIFLAHSSNDVIRFQASSGGFIKSFLVYLLESLTVDFAIITRTGGSRNPLLPETIITNSKEDILSTRTNSVYAVNNPFLALKGIDYDKKYAFVGLPCHVRNLRALQKKGQYRNIVIVIGLFCHHTPNIEFTRGILQKLNVKEHDVQQIEYRGSGWPGGFTAYLKNGQKKFVAQQDYWDNDLSNGPEMCKYCSEIAEDADIYVADPWNLKLERTDSKGTSLVICRNSQASRLVSRAAELGHVKIYKCSRKQLVQSQGYHIEEKIKRRPKKISNTKSSNSPDTDKCSDLLTSDLSPGFLSEEDAKVIMRSLNRVKAIEGDCLEIGSFLGRSSILIAKIVRDSAHLFCVDPWSADIWSDEKWNQIASRLGGEVASYSRHDLKLFEMFKYNIKKSGVDAVVTSIRNKSEEAIKEFKNPLKFIFIDGSHEYEYVKKDTAWVKYLVEGGEVVFHDYTDEWPGVKATVDEFASNRSFRLVDSGGCCICFKKIDYASNKSLENYDLLIMGVLENQNRQLQELKAALGAKDAQISNLEYQIQRSIPMQLVNRYQRIVEKLSPSGTHRRHLYELALGGVRVILTEGWKSFFKAAYRTAVSILKAILNKSKHLISLLREPDHFTLTYVACRLPIISRLLRKIFVNRVLIWYWREERKYINFGDYIAEVLMKKFGYKTVNYCNASLLGSLSNYDFCLLIIGSELHKSMVDWLKIPELYVWGQGKGHGEFFDITREPYSNKVKIFAVRGPHTIRQLNLDERAPLGDPALLMPMFFRIRKNPSQYKISYIPHWTNRTGWDIKKEELGAERFVDIMCSRRKFWSKLKEIVSSKFVLTNSFHTAVVCHAYGTPWALCLADGDKLNFPDKWRDFFEFLGIEHKAVAVRNYAEGLQWWDDVGSKAKTRDLLPLLDSFPLPIKNKRTVVIINSIKSKAAARISEGTK